ncbi:hypothetical protein AB4142_18775 [Variovorax sp. 2RAF20]|jgi:hypothetical protein
MSKNDQFNIFLSPRKMIHLDESGWMGGIFCEELQESFFSPSGCWGRVEYLTHWKAQLSNLLEDGSFAKLITARRDFETSNFIPAWIIFDLGEDFALRNKYYFIDHDRTPTFESFMEERDEREIFNEDGMLISEWILSRVAIKNFLASLE